MKNWFENALYFFSIILIRILDPQKYTKHFVPSRKFFPSSNLQREEHSWYPKIYITIYSFVEIYPFSPSNRDKINEIATTFTVEQGQERERIFHRTNLHPLRPLRFLALDGNIHAQDNHVGLIGFHDVKPTSQITFEYQKILAPDSVTILRRRRK